MTSTEQIADMKEVVVAAARATPQMIDQEVKIGNSKMGLWSIAYFLALWLFVAFAIPIGIASVRLTQWLLAQ